MVAGLLIGALAGCTTIGPVANPREYIPIKRPREVRLIRNDGTVWLMYRPVYEGDTLFGVVRGQGQRKILRSDIKGVEAPVPAPDKTRLFIIGGGAVAAVGLFWAIRHQSNTPPAPFAFCSADPDDCGA
jgi:hypothetical protein